MIKVLGLKTKIETKKLIELGDYVIRDLGYTKRAGVEIGDLDKIEQYRAMLI